MSVAVMLARVQSWYHARPWAQLSLCLGLTGAALGIHYWGNIPPDGTPLARPGDQGVPKPEAKRATKSRKKPRIPQRSLLEHHKALRAWADKPFADEPDDPVWSSRARSWVYRAVATTRQTVFEGALDEPEVKAHDVVCRTVRCRFELRSPYPYQLDLLLAGLRELEYGKRPLWDELIAEPGDDTDGQHVVVVTAAFRQPHIKPGRLGVADAKAAAVKAAKPAR